MGSRILLFTASPEPCADLNAKLAQCGFSVHRAGDIDSAALALRARPPAIIIFWAGAGAPIEECRALRSLSDDPILVISTSRHEDAIVSSLEAGADSVLVGPLSRRELAARISALIHPRPGLRRTETRRPTYRVDGLVIDEDARAVTRGGQRLSLAPTPFRLLAALARRAGTVVRHGELVAEVWGPDWADSAELLRPHIRYLRRKLGDTEREPRFLLTERGVGYRLV